MKKIELPKTILVFEGSKSFDEIEICDKCLVECMANQNDHDSWHECPKCGKENYIGKLKTISAKKITSYQVTIEI